MKELIFSKILGLLLITLLKNAPPQAFLNASITPINVKIWFKRTRAIPQIEKKRKILTFIGKDTPELQF